MPLLDDEISVKSSDLSYERTRKENQNPEVSQQKRSVTLLPWPPTQRYNEDVEPKETQEGIKQRTPIHPVSSGLEIVDRLENRAGS